MGCGAKTAIAQASGLGRNTVTKGVREVSEGSCALGPGGSRVTASAPLYPIFQAGVTDYVNRCDPARPTTFDVAAPEGTTVSVDGATARSGTFTTEVAQRVGERTTIVVTADGVTSTHHVRCLPTDFPKWSAERRGSPEAQFYATQTISFSETTYPTIFDTNGVPIWWLPRQSSALFNPLPNGNVALTQFGGNGIREFDLAGQLVQTVNTVGGQSDFHDVLKLPNGNYVMATVQAEPCALTSWGLDGPRNCLNHVFQELTPAGDLVWEWDTAAHIPVAETTEDWRDQQRSVDPATYDPWHYNSVEDTGDGFIISFRHLDAVYKIDKTTGAIVWKLSGTPRAESLDIVGDPLDGFSGQHDARLLDDGSVTLFDNGTLGLRSSRTPRSIRYTIDPGAGTATLVGDVRDPIAPRSACCGSTRVLPGGNRVTGWGGRPDMTENRPDGSRVFRLTLNGPIYRAIPLLPGQLTAEQLRTGMDQQYGG